MAMEGLPVSDFIQTPRGSGALETLESRLTTSVCKAAAGFMISGRPEIARELYEGALAESADPSVERTLCLQGIANTFAQENLAEEALDKLQAGLEAADASGLRDAPGGKATVREMQVDLAMLLSRSSRPCDSGMKAERRLLAIIEEVRSDPEAFDNIKVAELELAMGRLYWTNGKHWRSEERYAEAVQLFEVDEGSEGEAVAASLYNLAFAQAQLGKQTQAMQTAERTKTIFLQLYGEDDDRTVNAFLLFAQLSERLGRHDQAGKAYEVAVKGAARTVGGPAAGDVMLALVEAQGRLQMHNSQRRKAASMRPEPTHVPRVLNEQMLEAAAKAEEGSMPDAPAAAEAVPALKMC